MISLFSEHCDRWAVGCGSPICRGATKCFARGTVPSDILFIGEAPGESENALGAPFVGPAGRLLDRIIARALSPWQLPGTEGPTYNSLTWAFTNLVLCIPRDADGHKDGKPDDEAVRACQPRLLEMIEVAHPRLIVCVGNLARDFVADQGYKFAIRLPKFVEKAVSIKHPSYILQSNIAQQGLLVQEAAVTVETAVVDLFPTKEGPGSGRTQKAVQRQRQHPPGPRE